MQFNSRTETREWHLATDIQGCEAIEKRLKRMGLDLDLVEAQDTTDPILAKACIYDGPDADQQAHRWQSHNETNEEWES